MHHLKVDFFEYGSCMTVALKIVITSKRGGAPANERNKTCSKNWATYKKNNAASLSFSSPLESGQLEQWFF